MTDPTLLIRPGLKVKRDTLDLDFRQHRVVNDQHEVVWGLGFRHWDDRTREGLAISIVPRSQNLSRYNGFIQDTITLSPDKLLFMVGSKFEYNGFSGFEIQPSARLSWTPDEKQTLWTAFSRPVRTPSRFADGLRRTVDFFLPSVLAGNPDIESTDLTAYELGYRAQVTDQLTVDTAVFYFEYDSMLSIPVGGVGLFTNAGEGETYGAEVAATWRPADNFQLSASYHFVQVQLHGPVLESIEGNTPENQFQVRSSWEIADRLEFHGALYYVDNAPNQNAHAYFRLDLGMTWRPSEDFELAIWGQNLLDPSHLEFDETFTQSAPTEVERGVFLQATIKF